MSTITLQRPEQSTAKRVATLVALFALKGHSVHRLETGGFLVIKHNLHRHCGDVESLEAFARQVGAFA